MISALLTVEALDARVPVGTWIIDPMHSSIGFSVRHLMGKVRGTFEEFTGQLRIAEQPSGCTATATISTRSVNTANSIRDNDLRSANFFDADRYPEMTFESTGLTVNDGELELVGRLTIRDVTLQAGFLGLDETGLQGEQRIGISATTTIRRSDYGVGAAAGEGQKIVVGDKISILLDIQAGLDS